ncbi:decaprenyl-phosphate phosphoribosyltransferase [Candidatus Chloroploca asiatica]|uniref:Phosphoribose diphosphate--decaprenyl-phosphate phosphoribosyltransferase n=1 Tax=Candidatus Chloroploca asiatica TaxID=1506545 RepID=A0A2H3KI62_9CHLR|nr:decaprenyl-phosphate phosphoribosyltransferase [Candidatus Chloroploca asiatica]PDV97524.1 phosphoribose diphosphate--decaprenyl-phosphate phosphoribosyltransferase [Candidatus Chloroploca asiatica]
MSQPTDAYALLVQRGFVPVELLRTMRPKDWIKNSFVFAAAVFARDAAGRPLFLDPTSFGMVFGAFVLFCMAASAIYLVNDLVDIEKDRAHPKKRHRPLASGRLPRSVAVIAAIVLLGSALPLAFVIDWNGTSLLQNSDFGLALLFYVVVQGLLYSFFLKNIVIADIFTIALGFVLRTVAGALVLDIPITHWLLICMGMLALFLGLSKRRAEMLLLQQNATSHRRILTEYTLPMVDQMIGIVIAAAILAYTLFTTTAETMPHEPFPLMLMTVPFVVFAIFRYLYLVHRYEEGGNPSELLLKDATLTGSILLWGVIAVAVLLIAPV